MQLVQNQKFKTKQDIKDFIWPDSKTKSDTFKKNKSDSKRQWKEKMLGISNSCEDAHAILNQGILQNVHLCNIMKDKLEKKLLESNSES